MNSRTSVRIPVKSLKKALDLLSHLLFADKSGRGFTLSSLAEHFSLPVNTTHNLLKTMGVCGYIEQNAEGRYTFGPMCRRIAYRNFQSGDAFREKLLNAIRATVTDLHEPMVFSVLNDYAWTPIIRCEPSGAVVRVDMEIAERSYLFEAATGKILFAFSPPETRKKLIRADGDPEKAWPGYEKEVRTILRTKQVYSFRARYGVSSFAVPVPGRDGHLIGALGLYSIRNVWSDAEKKAVFTRMKQTAKEIENF